MNKIIIGSFLQNYFTTILPCGAQIGHMRNDAPTCFDLVVLAASAGGLEALSTVLGGLPADWPVPIAVVLHRTVRQPNLLATVLSRRTALRVKAVEPYEAMRPGTVYVARPDLHLVVQPDRTFACHDGRKIQYVLSSANPLFSSAARVLGPKLLAVVLTGGGQDAAEGALDVCRHGGTVIAQDRATSQVFGMPAAAIAAGAVHYTLPLKQIAGALISLVRCGTIVPPVQPPAGAF